MRRFIAIVVVLLLSSLLAISIQTQDDILSTSVAWIVPNEVFVWDMDRNERRQLFEFSDSVSVRRLNLSPDGTRLAFNRSMVADDGYSPVNQELSVVSVDFNDPFSDEVSIILNDLYPEMDGEVVISLFEWADNATLYFSTAIYSEYVPSSNEDLWRFKVDTGEVSSIVSRGAGGHFVLSPYRDAIIVMNAGDYNDEIEGDIAIVDSDSQMRTLMSFPAVATASEYLYYPPVSWLDEQTLWVATPDRDLIYQRSEDVVPTILWQIHLESGESEVIGEVVADFFGIPRLSSDGTTIRYIERTDFNEFDLYIADLDGANPQLLQTNISPQPRWLNGLNSVLFYTMDATYIQPLGDEAYPLGNQVEPTYIVRQVHSNANGEIVFVGHFGLVPDRIYEIYLTHIDALDEEPQLLESLASNTGISSVSLAGDCFPCL